MPDKFKFGLLCLCLAGSTMAYTDGYEVVIESNTPMAIKSLRTSAIKTNIRCESIGRIVEWTGLQLLNKPYVGALLEQSIPEYLYISLNATDCMLFVEMVLASSELIKANKLNKSNLINSIKLLRYHGDVSYCSRNHYFKDWALVNIQKGYLTDVAYSLTNTKLPYAADVISMRLKNKPNDIHHNDLACIKDREVLVNKQSIGIIPLKKLPSLLGSIKSGDIIGIVRTPNGVADSISHLGIASVSDGVVSMIHASSKFKKVVIADSITHYLGQYKDTYGILLLRPQFVNQ